MGMDTCSVHSTFMTDMRKFSHQIDISYSYLFFPLKLPISKITCHYEPSCFPGGSDGKKVCLQCMRPGFSPWVRKILCMRAWQPTPAFLPGESHGQRSLVGYSPWGHSRTRLNNFTFYEPSTFVSNSTHTSNWVLTSQIGVTEIIETHKNLQNSF